MIEQDGSIKIYTGPKFDDLIKTISSFYSNNAMKVKMVSRKLEADAGDFHLAKFTTFKSSQGYTGDFGNQYAMVIYDQAPG